MSIDKTIAQQQQALSTAHASYITLITALDPAIREQPGVCGTWSAKEVTAHLAGWDAAVSTFIADPERFQPPSSVDAFNADSLSERAHLSWDETLADLEAGFVTLEGALRHVAPAERIYGHVCTWLDGRTADYLHHTRQLQVWNEQA
jgi:hypothetical protein